MGADHVTPIGGQDPARALLVPLALLHGRVEQRTVDEVVTPRDRVEVAPDLVAGRVAGRGHVAHLLELRHVDVGLHVARQAGVPVPVPGATDPSGAVDEPGALDAGSPQVRTGEDPGDTRADNRDVDLVVDRIPLGVWGERIIAVRGEILVHAQVARSGAPLDHALAALLGVLAVDGLPVEGGLVGVSHRHLVRKSNYQADLRTTWCLDWALYRIQVRSLAVLLFNLPESHIERFVRFHRLLTG